MFLSESECSDSCSQCSSKSYSESEDETSASSEAMRTKPPPLPRVAISQNPTIMPVPIAQAEPMSTNSIRPNLHQYLERDNTIWNTTVKDDAHLLKDYNNIKPILSNQNSKWHSVDNVLLNYKGPNVLPINGGPSKPRSILDIKPRKHDERLSTAHFRHLFQTELREELPNTLYRYQNNNNYPTSGLNDRLSRHDSEMERPVVRPGERNKVKFSDTVTVAVVPVCEHSIFLNNIL